jgi:glycosyltransferase involved in cell wall biosynthesis
MMKKILIITAFQPSRIAGGTIFTKSLIHDLEKYYHVDVVVISTEDRVKKTERINNLNIYKISKISVLIKTLFFFYLNPLFIRRFSLTLLFLLRKMAAQNRYDLIIFDYSQVFLYSLFIHSPWKVLNYHDIMLQKFSREYFPINILSIPSYLFELLFSKLRNTSFITPTQKDSLILKSKYQQESVWVNYYLNDYILSLKDNLLSESANKYFVFFGDWKREENVEGLVWFLDNINHDEIKEFSFIIIGKDLNKRILSKIDKYKHFEYRGFVDNPYEIIARSSAVIAPVFKGAGIKIKVIESLACGTPVLGTKIAFEGLPEGFEEHLILCDSIKEYSEHLKLITLDNTQKIKLRNKFIEKYTTNTAGSYIRSILEN